MARISHGKESQLVENIRQVATSANGVLLNNLSVAQRNALLAAALYKLGMVDNEGRIDLSGFNKNE